MFNGKKIKEIEGDIKTLYTLFENLERKIKNVDTFKWFCANRWELDKHRQMAVNFCIHGMHPPEQPEPEYDSVSTKAVLDLILKKMGLRVGYKPGEEKTIQGIPSEFKLIKKTGSENER